MSSAYGSSFRRARAAESGTPWFPQDIDKVEAAVRRGMDVWEIDAMFPNRSYSSIAHKITEAKKRLADDSSAESDADALKVEYWTPEDDKILDDAISQGKTVLEIQSTFPQRSNSSLRMHIRRRTALLNDPSQQTTSQATPQVPPFNPWMASGNEFAGYNRVDTGYGGVAPNVNQHPDLANGLDFTPTPHRPGNPPGFVTSKQMFWGKK